MLQQCREHQVSTHHLFIDLQAEYDSVDCEKLWKITDENGFPGNLIRLIMMTEARCSEKISGLESDDVPGGGRTVLQAEAGSSEGRIKGEHGETEILAGRRKRSA